MEHAKSRTLFLALEFTALAVAGLLILIDYKLKKDLLTLFIRIEKGLASAKESATDDLDGSTDPGLVRAGDMVAGIAGVETLPGHAAGNANGSAAATARRSPGPKRGARAGSAKVPEPGK